MIKTIQKSFLVMMVLVSLLTLTSCNSKEKQAAQAALDEFVEQVTFANYSEVTTSFQLAARGKKAGFTIPITWESNKPEVIEIRDLVEDGNVSETYKTAKVVRPNKGDGNAEVTLKATFTVEYVEGKTLTATKEYKFIVLEEVSAIERGTIASIKAAAAKFYFEENGVKPGTSSSNLEFPCEFDATVTAVLNASGAGQFMVHDGTAGIYVYSNKTAVKVGDKVHVKGSITSYYGVLQVGANIEVTAGDFDDQAIVYSEDKTIQDLHDQSVNDGLYGGQALKLVGKLVYGKFNANDSDSYWLEDGITGAQVLVYYKSYNTEEDATLQGYVGKFVSMEVVTYDKYSTYTPYNSRVIANVATIKESAAPTLSAQDKVDQTVNKVNAVTLAAAYYNGDAFEFPTIDVAEGVTVTWAIEPAAMLVDGKLVITEAGTAKLVATVECEGLKEVVELTLNVEAELKTSTIAEAKEKADGANVVIEGIVTEITTEWSDKYGNISVNITDKTGTILAYRLATNVQVGQKVKITGKMGSYNGAKQIAAGATAEILEEAGQKATLAEANALTDGTKVILEATVKSIDTAWSDQYGNISVTIEDETGTLYCYRLATKVEVGDKLVVFGTMATYKEARQLAAGCLAVIVTE